MNVDPWDMVFVSPVASINAALEVSQGEPLGQLTIATDEAKSEVRFSRWRIVNGGSERYVLLNGEIAEGTVSLKSLQGWRVVDLKGGSVTLKVDLMLMTSESGASCQDLVLIAQGVPTPHKLTMADPQHQVASSVSLQGANVCDPIDKAIVEECIAVAISQRATPIKFLLGTLKPTAVNGDWLAPASSAEIYEVGQDDGDGVIAILGVTQKKDISTFVRQLPPEMMVADNELSVAISSGLFAQHIMVAAIAKSFGVSSSSFPLQADGSYLCSSHLKMKTISKLKMEFTPVVESIKASLSSSNIVLELAGHCDLKLNIDFTFTSKIQLAPTVDEPTGEIRFDLIGTPSLDHNIHIPWYDYAAAAVTGVVDVFIPAFIALLVKLLTSSLEDHVGDQTHADSQIGDLQQVFVWNAAPNAKPTHCELSDAFVVTAQAGELS